MLSRRGWLGIVALVALALGGCGSSQRPLPGRPGTVQRATAVLERLNPQLLVARVEKLRGLKFTSVPKFDVMSPAQGAAAAAAILAREQPVTARNNTLLRLMGIVPPSFSLNTYYSIVNAGGPISAHTLKLVATPAQANRAAAVDIAVQQLTVALDEQHFHPRVDTANTEAVATHDALLEGDADDIAQEYAQRYRLAVPRSIPDDIAALPYALEYNIYDVPAQSAGFVTLLRNRGHGWDLVNAALSSDPPSSLADIITPLRYLDHIGLASIKMSAARYPFAPRGHYRKVLDYAFDPIDVIDLLATNRHQAGPAKVAGDLNGGRVELWRAGSSDCPGACAHHAFAMIGTAWLSPAAATTFAGLVYKRLRSEHARLVEKKQAIYPDGDFKLRDGGYASINLGYQDVSLAWGPDMDSAGNLAFLVGSEQGGTG